MNLNLRSTLGRGLRDSGGDSDGDSVSGDNRIEPGTSVLGTQYDIDPIEEIREAEQVTKIKIPAPEDDAKETDTVAGPALMQAIEQAYEDADDEELIVPIGYNASDRELEIVGFPLSDLFEHTSITGTTGAAKTTTMLAMMVTLAYDGTGFFGAFPKGSEDSKYLVRCLPEFCLDRLVIIDPTETKYTIPQNIFDVPEYEDEDDRNDEINKRIDVLLAILMQDWGDNYINVETIIEVTGRAFMLSDDDFCLLDMFLFIISQERRENFAEKISDPFLKDAAREIAKMDDDVVRPVAKRLMSWVLDPTIRRMISHRKSKLDWREVVEEDKIVLLRLGVSDQGVKRKLMLNNWRELTAAVEQRYAETGRRRPYLAFLDEFDSIASSKLELQDNLARMRGAGLGINILCQYPGQLPDESRNSVLDGFKNNINNTVALKMKDKDNARVLTDKLRGVEPDDLVHLPKYQCWTDVPVGAGQRTDALRLNTFPPMAPLRSEEEAERIIHERLKAEGEEPPTLREMIEECPLDVSADELLMVEDDEGETIELDGSLRPSVCKAVYDQAIREHDDGTEWVRIDTAAGRIRRYLPGDDQSQFDNAAKLWNGLIAQLPESYLEREDRDGDIYLRCTDTGYRDFITPDYDPDGDSTVNNNQGGAAHNLLIENGYDDLTRLGFVVAGVLGQTGEAMPDSMATLDDVEHLDVRGATPGVGARRMGSQKQWQAFSEEYPLLDRLSNGQDLAVESEKSTAETKAGQTIVNLAKATNDDRRCLFLCRTVEEAENIWEKLAMKPRHMRMDYPKPGQHRLYNLSKPLTIGGNIMYRPASAEQTVWVYDERNDTYRLLDSEGEQHATFDEAWEIFEKPQRYPLAEGETKDYDDWKEIKHPVVPAYEFDEIPDEGAWDVAVVDDGVSIYDGDADELVPIGELLEYEQSGQEESLDFLDEL